MRLPNTTRFSVAMSVNGPSGVAMREGHGVQDDGERSPRAHYGAVAEQARAFGEVG
jgi:hypothetical protein